MNQLCSSANSLASILGSRTNGQVIASIYFPEGGDKLDRQDCVALNIACNNLRGLTLRIGCFADVWIEPATSPTGNTQYALDLGKRRAAAVRQYLNSTFFTGAVLHKRGAVTLGPVRAVSKAQPPSERRVDLVLTLSADTARIQNLERQKKELYEILKQSKEWESVRQSGILNVYTPGKMTTYGIGGVADWVNPKSDKLGPAVLAAAKAPFAAFAIFLSTPLLLLTDSMISVYQVARHSMGAAPPGAYVTSAGARTLLLRLDAIYKEIQSLKQGQIRIP